MNQLAGIRSAVAAVLAAAGIADAEHEAAIIVEARAQADHDAHAAAALEAARRRASGTPLAYLAGHAQFMGVEMLIAQGVLVPREETELLGRTALEILDGTGVTSPQVIDMCCGSGNLACALATLRPSIRVWASDLTDGAVVVARQNVDRLGIADRVVVAQGDLFAPLADRNLAGTIDVVVCNPPYISTGKLERERADLPSHEPREAFDGGPYGVAIFQRVIRDAVEYLKPGGHLLFEIGAGQERQISLLFGRAAGYEHVIQKSDEHGTPRVVVGRKK